jgi:hypothetical protein
MTDSSFPLSRFTPARAGSRASRVSQKRRALSPTHPAHPAHPDWRVSRSPARKSAIFPLGPRLGWAYGNARNPSGPPAHATLVVFRAELVASFCRLPSQFPSSVLLVYGDPELTITPSSHTFPFCWTRVPTRFKSLASFGSKQKVERQEMIRRYKPQLIATTV